MKKVELNGFTFQQDGLDVIVAKDGKPILRFTGPHANQNINAVIVGLMAVNPGPNPTLWSTATVAKHFGRAASVVTKWRHAGRFPAILDILTTDVIGGRKRLPQMAFPADLLHLVTVPTPGNPAFKTDANPSFSNRKDKRGKEAKTGKTGTKLGNIGD